MTRFGVFCTALSLVFSLETARADLRDGVGTTVAEIGDVDRDGAPDLCLLIRARGLLGGRFAEDFAEVERAPLVPHLAVISGANGETLRIFPAFTEEGQFTSLVCGLGDVNGDRRADVLVGGEGTVRCYSALTAELLWEAGAALERKRFGQNLLRVPDTNGDDCDDVIAYCGPTRVRGRDSELFLLSGANGEVLRGLGGQVPAASDRDPAPPFTLLTFDPAQGGNVHKLSLCRPIALFRDAKGVAGNALTLVVRWPSLRRSEPEVFEGWTLQLADFELRQEAILPGRPWAMAALGSVDGDEHSDYALASSSKWLKVQSGGNGEVLYEHSYEGGHSNGEGTHVASLRDVNGDGVRDFVMGANEEGTDCDAGSARVFSGADGSVLWRLDFQGKNGPQVGPCGIGVDTCACPSAREKERDNVAVFMPRLHEARMLDGRNGATLWRWAYDVQRGGVVPVAPSKLEPGKLLASR